jgi:hypothetical protein
MRQSSDPLSSVGKRMGNDQIFDVMGVEKLAKLGQRHKTSSMGKEQR